MKPVFKSKMRQTSGTIIWCLGVILSVTIVQGSFHFRPEWEDDILDNDSDEYTDDFYAPVRLGRQAPGSPLTSSQLSLKDLQSIINQFAQSTGDQNARQIGSGYGQSYSQGLGSGYGSGLSQSYSQGSPSVLGSGYGSGLSQSYSQGSSSVLGSGYGPGLSQSYSQGSSSVLGSGYGPGLSQSYSQAPSSGSASASGSANSQPSFLVPSSGVGSGYRPTSGEQNSLLPSNRNQQASSQLSSLNSLLNNLQQKVEQVKINRNSLNGQSNLNAKSNPSNVETPGSATNGLKLFKKLLRQSPPSNNQGESTPSTLNNLSDLSKKNQLLKQAAILLSHLSTTSGISKFDIIKIIQETANDIKQYPSTKKSVLNLEIQVLLNLVNRLQSLENSSNLKNVHENTLNSLNNIVPSIRNNGNGSSKSGNPDASTVPNQPSGLSDPSVSSDSEIRNILYILNVIQNVVNDLEKIANNNNPSSSNTPWANGPSSTDTSSKISSTFDSLTSSLITLQDSPTFSLSTLQEISDALLKLVKKVTESVDDLLKNIIGSNYPSANTGPFSGSQPLQSNEYDLESTIKKMQKATKNLKAVANSKLISEINSEPLTSFNSENNNDDDDDEDDDDWTNKGFLEDSIAPDENEPENVAEALEKLLNGVNAVVSNLLESVTESGNRNPKTLLSPANDSSKILKIRKLLISLLNNPSSTLPLSQIVTGLRAQDVMQALKGLNSSTDSFISTSSPSTNANSNSNQGTIKIDEMETPVVDYEGNYYTLRRGNYEITPSSGKPISGRYLIDDISSVAYPDGSVRTIESGPFVQTSGRLANSAPNTISDLSQNNDASTSPSSSTQSKNEGDTYTFNNNLNTYDKSRLENLIKFVKSLDGTSESPSSSDSYYSSSAPDSNSFSSLTSSTPSTSSSISESPLTDFTLKQKISKLIEELSSLLPSSSDPNSSSGPSSSSTSSSSTNSHPTNNGLPSSNIAELQKLLTTLSTQQSSTAKSPSSNARSSSSYDMSGSPEYISSATSDAESQSSSTDSSSESQLHSPLIQLNNSPSRSSSGKYPTSSLYPGLDNLQINSGHDTRVVITPCSKSTDMSSSDSISDGTSVSSGTSSSDSSSSTSTSPSSSSSSYQTAESASGNSFLSDETSPSLPGSSSSSSNRYQGFDINSDTADYTLVPGSTDGSSGFASGLPPRIASGQYSNSDSSFGHGSVTLPRTNVISAIGDESLIPGDQVQVITKNGVLNAYVNDSHGPITFVPSDPWILLNDSEGTGKTWKISSSNFNDDDFEHLEQCGCIDD